MRRNFLAIPLLLFVGCASTPDLTAYRTSDVIGTGATIWADNQQTGSMMIIEVDGKGMPSRGWNGYPYAVTVAPGKHRLRVLVNESPYYARVNVDADIALGHTYTLKYTTYSRSVKVEIIDLGENMICSYNISGDMQGGYVPVELSCRKA